MGTTLLTYAPISVSKIIIKKKSQIVGDGFIEPVTTHIFHDPSSFFQLLLSGSGSSVNRMSIEGWIVWFYMQAMNSNQSSMLILQETCTDPSGSLVVYAPVDIPAMHVVMNGGDSAYVALLPSGFAIVPLSLIHI